MKIIDKKVFQSDKKLSFGNFCLVDYNLNEYRSTCDLELRNIKEIRELL